MTRKELKRWIETTQFTTEMQQNQGIRVNELVIKKGYCCYQNLPSEEKEYCIEIGSNSGVYGWNWAAYYNYMENILYIDGYRNMI